MPEIQRSGNHGVAFVVLQPRSVHDLPVRRINHDLRVKLPCRKWKERVWCLPRNPIVVAYEQRYRRCRAARTVRHSAILRIEDINVSVAVGSDSRLPLVPGDVAHPPLRHEARDCESGPGGHEQGKEDSKFLHSPAAAGFRTHRSTPGTTLPGLYREI